MNTFPTNGQTPWNFPFNGFPAPFPFPQNFNPYWNAQAFWNQFNTFPPNFNPNYTPNFAPNFGWGFQGQFPTPYGTPYGQPNPWQVYAQFNPYQQFSPWGGNAYAGTFPGQGTTPGFPHTGVSPGFFPGNTQGFTGQPTGNGFGGFGGFGYPTNTNAPTTGTPYPYTQTTQGNYGTPQQAPLNNTPWAQPNFAVPPNSNGYFNTQQFQYQPNPFQPTNGTTPQNGTGEAQETAAKRNGVSR